MDNAHVVHVGQAVHQLLEELLHVCVGSYPELPKGLRKEHRYTLNHGKKAYMILGLFLNQGLLQALGSVRRRVGALQVS